MPELPEVETIRLDLIKKLLNIKIEKIVIRKKTIIKGDYKKFISILNNNFIKDIKRIGKLLIFELGDNKNILLIHLKMTGQLIYKTYNKYICGGHNSPIILNDLPGKHTHIIFNFKDSSKLFFNDVRRFGYLKVIDKLLLDDIKKNYGIEPLKQEFNFKNLKLIFKNRKSPIKAVLLNQKLISGIGNIYVDEILYASGMFPGKKANKIKDYEIKKIIISSNKIIKKSIKFRGTTFSDYHDCDGRKGNFSDHLKVYGREGERCFKCGNIIKKIKLAGRGTNFCQNCQK